jgi:hypothetical protein
MCYMHRPSYSSRVDHPNNTGWEGHVIKLTIMQFSAAMFSFVSFMLKKGLMFGVKNRESSFASYE